MRKHGVCLSCVWAALLLALLPAFAAAQEERPRVPFRGSHGFRHILSWLRLTPIPSSDRLGEYQPRDVLLVLFGDPQPLGAVQDATGGLDAFIRRGGAVLIATDREESWHLLRLKVRSSGQPVFLPPWQCYRGIRECPLITDGLNTGHPIFAGLTQGLATNRPTALVPADNVDLLTLASFRREPVNPPAVEVPQPGDPPRFRVPGGIVGRLPRLGNDPLPDNAAYILGSSGEPDAPERVLLLGGHGVFMNGMIAQRDNDNFQFACNALRWLTNNGQRRQVLFIEEGKVQTEFKPALVGRPPIPMPTEEVINKLLVGVDEEDLLNRALLHVLGPQAIWRGALLVGAVVLLFLGLRRLLTARQKQEKQLPLVERSLEKAGTPLPALQQRQAGMIQVNNFAEAAQALASNWLLGRLGERARQQELPQIEATSSQTTIQRELKQVWQWAHAQYPPTCSRRQLRGLLALLHRLEADLTRGRWRWAESGGSTSPA